MYIIIMSDIRLFCMVYAVLSISCCIISITQG